MSEPSSRLFRILCVPVAFSLIYFTIGFACAADGNALSPEDGSVAFSDVAHRDVDFERTDYTSIKSCAAMPGAMVADVTVQSASLVAPGGTAPEHCSIRGQIGSYIQFEIDLPQKWNGRIYMFGNGGSAGESPDEPPRPTIRDRALSNGFAVASTNTGHNHRSQPAFSFMRNREQLDDYGYRAVHETISVTKAAVDVFYGREAAHSYWDGCSTGGREGLMEAQRFPDDFDGLVTGAPALDFTNLILLGLWNGQQLEKTPLARAKVELVGRAIYEKCDSADGLQDGLISDPPSCKLDVERDVPRCATGKSSDLCLTPAEADTFRALYQGPTVNGTPVFHGLVKGAELPVVNPRPETRKTGWPFDRQGNAASGVENSISAIQNSLGLEEGWDWTKFPAGDAHDRLSILHESVDATNPDLGPLNRRGGKIIMYYGWSDVILNPEMGVEYFGAVQKANGPSTSDFFRLFMVPGMFHCRGGYGPTRFDAMTAVINWVEAGKPPMELVASDVRDGQVVRQRPLCPFPQQAQLIKGKPPELATSFVCAVKSAVH